MLFKVLASAIILLSIQPKIIWSPEEVDPMGYWDHFLDSFTCNFKDMAIYDERETIFDNWRMEMKRGWD